ncbi:ABC transporter ATP-binding protein [Paucilactobacillus suebicus]|uniref:ABC-type quaternary amine transporter n=1 Tax=Paucilactobacillus suebicus DSM 5007 = KCTC 3549 TaxID=1423807 RepID=A0A0R1VXK7_9LACO|nr:ABC transporter ATP-binding protein [Paucilactobacillus suebicus]KRM10295.1 glycine betaine L-proline transport ATP binding subunit [Paucilactobacillus suebicus DSM 5007 = KCTC 3549]
MTNEQPVIQVDNITKKFGNVEAVRETSFTVNAGEFITILGTSGSGKTTLLKMLNRLIEPTSGAIYIDGENTKDVNVNILRRRIGYVIQQHGLFDHWTVEQNIATVCNILKWDKQKTAQRIDETLRLVQLDPAKYRKRHPHQLSGGEQQRVGIARALAADPKILLMDEPFGAIDAVNRAKLQDELKEIQKTTGKTIIFVTHDIDEALKLGNRTMLFKDGKIQQFDNKNELFLHPQNEFVGDFLGVSKQLSKWRYLSAKSLIKQWKPVGGQLNNAIDADAIVAKVVERLLKRPADPVQVVDRDENKVGYVRLNEISEMVGAI